MGLKYNKDFFTKIKSRKEAIDKIMSEETTNRIVQEIADAGAEIASELFGSGNISVTSSKANAGQASIIAKGDQVAYIEFGTGEYAKGTYKGELPKSGVPITGKWEHYYPSPHKVTLSDGRKGWMAGKSFHIGRPAGSQMWQTSQELREISKDIAVEVIKDVLNGG